MSSTVQVSIPVPTNELYSYSVPKNLRKSVEIGKRILVPFRNRRMIGFVVGFEDPPDDLVLKNIDDVVDDYPLFDKGKLEFFNWISNYYLTSLSSVLKVAHPGGLGTSLRRLIEITEKGIRQLNTNSIGVLQRQIISSIYHSKQITVEKLFDLIEDVNFNHINSLKAKGLIDFNYEIKIAKPKFRKVISLNDSSSLEQSLNRMPAKASILDFVLTHGSVTYDDLKEIFPNVSSHLKWLEEKGFVKIELQELLRDPFRDIQAEEQSPPKLTVEQKIALKDIYGSIEENEFSSFLLHGVTGSGKTEVYLRAINEVIKKGKQAIVLVPEISLTPQLIKRFKSRFGDQVAVIHSLLSDGERFDAWRRARSGEVKIVIGARSAIFAPFKNLGIIVVDEEHETSYKQEEAPCYNARDIALVLGQITNSAVILGSATPSLESYANSLKGKFTYLSLPLRVGRNLLPKVEVVDMRKSKGLIFSPILKKAIVENFKNNNQTIIFLNRRGFSTVLVYESSGEIFNCPNCSIPFTYHKIDNNIKCHYCGTSENFDKISTDSDSPIRGFGIGTQMVEQEIKSILPNANVERMDRDSTGSKLKLLNLYKKLEKGVIDILIGTQMVAKGHDLPGVTLVGVVSADISLAIPDFRSGERTFQLVTQVAGRAGRGDLPGRVIVQTFNPNHPSIMHAIDQDSIGFLNEEIKIREMLNYPPYSKIVNLRISGSGERETADFVKDVGRRARGGLSKLPIRSLEILGPSQCPIYKINNRYRWQIILKSKDLNILHSFSNKLYELTSINKGKVRISLDIDPLSFS